MKGVHIEGEYIMAEIRKNIAVRRTAQVLKSFTQEPKVWGISALASHKKII